MLHTGLHEVLSGERVLPVSRRKHLLRIAVIAACAFFISTCLLTALTKLPYVDEGTFGGSAVNIIHTGFSGNPSTPPWGLGIPLIESTRYNFWVMPGYLYTLAGWFRIAPASVMSGRMLSIIFGVGALILFYSLIRLLKGSRTLATLSVVLLATDFNMILRSSISRMDSMSLMLNLAAWVAYLKLRRDNLSMALFVSSVLAALSVVTHPNGIIAFFGIVILVFVLDRARLTPRCAIPFIAGAAVPTVAAASLILQAPAVWTQQVHSHAIHRFSGLEHPLTSIWEEFLNRYYWTFGGLGFGSPLDTRYPFERMILLLVLVAYSAAAVAMFFPRFRRTQLVKSTLSIFLATTIYFTFFETGKLVVYNLHILPWFCLFLATVAIYAFEVKRLRLATAAALAVVFLVNFTSVMFYDRSDHYRQSYVPVVNLFRSTMGPNDLVLTHAYFGFELGFNRVTEDFTLVDIVRRKPLYVTLDHWFTIPATTKTYRYGLDPVAAGMITDREKAEAVELLQTKYRVVLTTRDYQVYRRTDPF